MEIQLCNGKRCYPSRWIDHWVTSLYTVTETIDGEEVAREEMFDVQIENEKIKNIMVASRAVITQE